MSNKTWTELTTNLQQWLEDDDSEFTVALDEIVNLGEMRLWRDLDLAIFSSIDSTPTVMGTDTLAKPTGDADLVNWQSLYYDDTGERFWLELRSYGFVRDHQTIAATAKPIYYAELDETDWLLSPIPDAVYTVNTRGITRPTRLSSGNPTTWLSDHQDDMLFKACLAEAEGFLKSDDRKPMWEQAYGGALPLAKRETYELLNSHYNLTPLEIPGVPTTQR